MTAPKEVKVLRADEVVIFDLTSKTYRFFKEQKYADQIQNTKHSVESAKRTGQELMLVSDYDSQVQALKADLERLVKEYSVRDASESNLAREIGDKRGIKYE